MQLWIQYPGTDKRQGFNRRFVIGLYNDYVVIMGTVW